MAEQNDGKKINPWAYVLIGAAGLGMLFIGVPFFGGHGGGSQTAATVNGKDISTYQFNNAVNALRAQLGTSQNDNNAIRQTALQQLISQTVLSQHALQSGYEYSDKSLETYLHQQFPSAKDYENMLKNLNINAQSYENGIRNSETQQNYYEMLIAHSVPETVATEALFAQLAQTRDMELIRLPLAQAESGIQIDDNAIQNYYDAHQANYQTQQTVDIQYIILSADNLADTSEVSAEALAQARAKEQENSQRDGHYIIFDQATDAEQAATALKDGSKTFEQISADIQSGKIAGQAGVLDKHAKGKGVSEQADDALFALAKTGDVSPVFTTEYGKMMVQLGEIDNPAETLSDEQLKAKIAQEQAGEHYTQLANHLFDVAQNGDDITQLAKQAKLTVQTLDNITANTVTPEWLKNPQLQSQLFGEHPSAVDKLGTPIEIDHTHSLFFTVSKRELPQTQPLSQVREQVIADLRRSEAQTKLEKTADNIKTLWEKGEDITAVIQDNAGKQTTLQNLSQLQPASTHSEISPELLTQLLSQDTQTAIHAAQNGDIVISRLLATHAGQLDTIHPEMRTIVQAQLNDSNAQNIMKGIVNYLREQAKIEVNNAVVNSDL